VKKYSAAIIGCGNVAGMYGGMDNRIIQSHAQAYTSNPRTDLLAVFDPIKSNLSSFCKKWNVDNQYLSLESMLDNHDIDIISICSPTDYHYEQFQVLAGSSISAIFAEKPLSNDLDQSKKIIDLTKNIPVAINYFRRWNHEFSMLKNSLNKGQYGDVKKVMAQYTKGIKNNGSHLLDVLHWFFDELKFHNNNNKYDVIDNDQGIDCNLSFNNNIPIIFSHIPNVDYVYIELDFICEKGLIKITQRGQKIEIYIKEQDPDYLVFNKLSLAEEIVTNWNNCFFNAVNNIIANLEGNEAILCTPEDAYKSSLLCEQIIASN